MPTRQEIYSAGTVLMEHASPGETARLGKYSGFYRSVIWTEVVAVARMVSALQMLTSRKQTAVSVQSQRLSVCKFTANNLRRSCTASKCSCVSLVTAS